MSRPNKIRVGPEQNVTAFFTEEMVEKWDRAVGVKANSDEAVINIYQQIGDSFFEDGFTAKLADAALREIGDRDVTVNINSLGGSYFEGISIYNLLLAHTGKVTVKVIGIAASAASVIAMAADELLIASTANIMIHNANVTVRGNRRDLQETADWLKSKIDEPMASVYAQRSEKPVEDVKALMDAETYLLGQEAVDAGFADGLIASAQITKEEPAKASINAIRQVEAVLTQSMSRTEARKAIQQIRGKPGAAPKAKQDAGDTALPEMAALLETLRK